MVCFLCVKAQIILVTLHCVFGKEMLNLMSWGTTLMKNELIHITVLWLYNEKGCDI